MHALFIYVQDDHLGNLNLALEIAEKHLDIPKMLDPEGALHMHMHMVPWIYGKENEIPNYTGLPQTRRKRSTKEFGMITRLVLITSSLQD